MVARNKVTLFVLVTILIMANVKADNMVKTDLKVGVVSANKIVGESREGIKTNTELMGKYKEVVEESQQQEKQFNQAVKDFEDKKATLSVSAREAKQKELARMEREFKNKSQQNQEDLNMAAQQAQERLGKELVEAAAKIAEAKGLDLLLDKDSGRVLYASSKADYSDNMVGEMDKQYEVKLAQNKKDEKKGSTVS